MERALLEYKVGIFELWQTTGGRFYAVNNNLESERQVSETFARDAMSHNENHFIDLMSLLTFN